MIYQRIKNPLFPGTDEGAGTKKENKQKKKQERYKEQMHKLKTKYHNVKIPKKKKNNCCTNQCQALG